MSLASRTYGVTKVVTHSWGYTFYLNSTYAGWIKSVGYVAGAAAAAALGAAIGDIPGAVVGAVAGSILTQTVDHMNVSTGIWVSFNWPASLRSSGCQ
jgi:hypothetical protein